MEENDPGGWHFVMKNHGAGFYGNIDLKEKKNRGDKNDGRKHLIIAKFPVGACHKLNHELFECSKDVPWKSLTFKIVS